MQRFYESFLLNNILYKTDDYIQLRVINEMMKKHNNCTDYKYLFNSR